MYTKIVLIQYKYHFKVNMMVAFTDMCKFKSIYIETCEDQVAKWDKCKSNMKSPYYVGNDQDNPNVGFVICFTVVREIFSE